MPDVCPCPHDCVSQRAEAARLSELDAFLGGNGDLADSAAGAESVFSLFGEVA
jgi:hypothetical protein